MSDISLEQFNDEFGYDLSEGVESDHKTKLCSHQ